MEMYTMKFNDLKAAIVKYQNHYPEITFNNLDDALRYYIDNIDASSAIISLKSNDTKVKEITTVSDFANFVNSLPRDPKEQDVSFKNVGKELNKPVDKNLKTIAAANKPKLSDVPPVSLFALGGAMSDGATKYGRFNWRETGSTSSVFYDAIIRHLTDWYNGEDYAHDSKIHHLGHIMASCAILLDSAAHNVLNDDRDKRKPDSISRNPNYWKQ
jgi:hypothetical protein